MCLRVIIFTVPWHLHCICRLRFDSAQHHHMKRSQIKSSQVRLNQRHLIYLVNKIINYVKQNGRMAEFFGGGGVKEKGTG